MKRGTLPQVIQSFIEQKPCMSDSETWISDGVRLSHHGTTIAQWDADYLYLNMTKYTSSTSFGRNTLIKNLKDKVPNNRRVFMEDDFPLYTKELVL